MLNRSLVINGLLASRMVSPRQRARAYRRLGLQVGRARIAGAVIVSGRDVAIGDGTFINYGCFLDGDGSLRIGQNCDIAQRVSLHTVTHEIAGPERRAGERQRLRTSIGDGTWIGAGSVVLPGVTVGEGCVIAAGSVVTSDCAPSGLYAGVPARRLRDLPQ